MTHYDYRPPLIKQYKDYLNKELNMTIDKNRIEIDGKDIQVGDLIRVEYEGLDTAHEKRATHARWYGGIGTRYFLLDRPKKIKWAKGTTLYGTRDWFGWFSEGDPLLVTKDYYEGDITVRLQVPSGRVGHWRDADDGITDIKPEPHPVGATRWVTEDHKSVFGHPHRKGDAVVITEVRNNNDKTHDIVVRPPNDRSPVYAKSKYLSATSVEPAPVYVSVRKDAVERLRHDHRHAPDLHILKNSVTYLLASVDE